MSNREADRQVHQPELRSTRLDRPAIHQILKTVGAKFVKEAVDYDVLAEELMLAFRLHDTRQQLERDDSTEWQVRKEIEKIMAWAKRFPTPGDRAARLLSEEMGRDPETQSRARGVWDFTDEQTWSLGKLQQGLEALERAAPRLLKCESLAMGWRTPGEPMANYWLMGALADIYTRLVGRKAFGIGRSDDGVPGGPGIRFILAVLEIAGLKNRDGRPWGP
jgi:hypothetical protein